MGGGAGSGIEWVGFGKGVIGAYLARWRAKRAVLNATRAMLAGSSQPKPQTAACYVRMWRRFTGR
jgi:hypothetical protein